jgi:predicted N-acetyltransferase YhbS
MRPEDVPAVERLTDEGFHDLDVRTHRAGRPAPTRRSAERSAAWQHRLRHLLAHDAAGCWVAEDDSGIVGAAAALRRDTMWLLATFVVRPGRQRQGLGKQLLEAALAYGRGCLRGMIAASDDPAAVRRYRLAGFDVHPTMLLTGPVDRDVLPVVEHVRDATAADRDLMDSVDRQVRGAAHGVDHAVLGELYRAVVVDRPTGSGYAYVDRDGGPYLLAATSRRAATALLWETLAATSPDRPATVSHVTTGNGWAIDVGMAARMELHTRGYLALRGMGPPAPYLPSGQFL